MIVDNYDANAYIFHQKFKVGSWKLQGWKRLMGQEVAFTGYTQLLSVTGQPGAPSPIANLVDVNAAPVAGAPVNASQTARQMVKIVDGFQTPQATQPVCDMWIPLIFW